MEKHHNFLMLQPCHRGIYEYLWSEHKYSIIGISIKASQSVAANMGRKPQLLSFLKKLAAWITYDRPEWYNSLLNAYMHIKPLINRQKRLAIIEEILENHSTAADSIFLTALQHQEKSLGGCRIFYSAEHAVYKFWDAQDRPGLWICFGPFQMHLTPEEVFNRVAMQSNIDLTYLKKLLEDLQNGIPLAEFETIPDSLRRELDINNMIAIPGSTAYLHPRINLAGFPESLFKQKSDIHSIAATTLERVIDLAPAESKPLGMLPDYNDFCRNFSSDSLPHITWQQDFSGPEAFDFIASLFWERQCFENGLISTSGVGMQAADEEVDPEECEHGDDEADD